MCKKNTLNLTGADFFFPALLILQLQICVSVVFLWDAQHTIECFQAVKDQLGLAYFGTVKLETGIFWKSLIAFGIFWVKYIWKTPANYPSGQKAETVSLDDTDASLLYLDPQSMTCQLAFFAPRFPFFAFFLAVVLVCFIWPASLGLVNTNCKIYI